MADEESQDPNRAWIDAIAHVNDPSPLELASTGLLLQGQHEDSANSRRLLQAVMVAAVKWNQPKLWTQAAEKWSSVVASESLAVPSVLDAIHRFGFELVRAGLEKSFDTATVPKLAYRWAEELAHHLKTSRAEDAEASAILSWLSDIRIRLAQTFASASDDIHEKVVDHCLKSGGLDFMLKHLKIICSPYSPASLQDLTKCIYAELALPTIPPKQQLVADLLQLCASKICELPEQTHTTRFTLIKPFISMGYKLRAFEVVQRQIQAVKEGLRPEQPQERSQSSAMARLQYLAFYAAPLLRHLDELHIPDDDHASAALIQEALLGARCEAFDLHLHWLSIGGSHTYSAQGYSGYRVPRSSYVDDIRPMLENDGLVLLLSKATQRAKESLMSPEAIVSFIAAHQKEKRRILDSTAELRPLWTELIETYGHHVSLSDAREACDVLTKCANEDFDKAASIVAQRITDDAKAIKAVDEPGALIYDCQTKMVHHEDHSKILNFKDLLLDLAPRETFRDALRYCDKRIFIRTVQTLLNAWIGRKVSNSSDDAQLQKHMEHVDKEWICDRRPACASVKAFLMDSFTATSLRACAMKVRELGPRVLPQLVSDLEKHIPRSIATWTASEHGGSLTIKLTGSLKAHRIRQNRKITARDVLATYDRHQTRSSTQEKLGEDIYQTLLSWTRQPAPTSARKDTNARGVQSDMQQKQSSSSAAEPQRVDRVLLEDSDLDDSDYEPPSAVTPSRAKRARVVDASDSDEDEGARPAKRHGLRLHYLDGFMLSEEDE